MGIDILGIDIMGIDILGIDIVALPRHRTVDTVRTRMVMHANQNISYILLTGKFFDLE